MEVVFIVRISLIKLVDFTYFLFFGCVAEGLIR